MREEQQIVHIVIDEREIDAFEGESVLQAARRHDIERVAHVAIRHLRDVHQPVDALLDLDEGAELLDLFAHRPAGGRIGRDRGAERDAAVLGDLAGDESDATHVDIAVLLREAQFAGKIQAHHVTVQQGNRAAAILDELGRGENYVYLVDEESRATVELGVFGVPETFFVDRDGIVRGRVQGELSPRILTQALDDVLDGFYGDIPEEAQAQVTLARRNAERVLDLINEMLDIAKLEAVKSGGQAE